MYILVILETILETHFNYLGNYLT